MKSLYALCTRANTSAALHFQFQQNGGCMEDGNNKVDADYSDMKIIFSPIHSCAECLYCFLTLSPLREGLRLLLLNARRLITAII